MSTTPRIPAELAQGFTMLGNGAETPAAKIAIPIELTVLAAPPAPRAVGRRLQARAWNTANQPRGSVHQTGSSKPFWTSTTINACRISPGCIASPTDAKGQSIPSGLPMDEEGPGAGSTPGALLDRHPPASARRRKTR